MTGRSIQPAFSILEDRVVKNSRLYNQDNCRSQNNLAIEFLSGYTQSFSSLLMMG